MGIIERIKEIETEMARTQKNKATCFVYVYLFFNFFNGVLIGICSKITKYHLGQLKAKIKKEVWVFWIVWVG